MADPRPANHVRRWILAAAVAGGFGVAVLLERWVYEHAYAFGRWWYEEHLDTYFLFRNAGFWPSWLAIGIGVAAIKDCQRRETRALSVAATPPEGGRTAPHWAGGVLLMAATGVAGLLVTALKLIVRRERPTGPDEPYKVVFRPWAEQWWNSAGLSFPSGHTLIAFVGAAILWRLYPRGWWLWLGWALGCAIGRVSFRGHYLTDVYASAVIGLLLGLCVFNWAQRRWGRL